MSYGVVSPSLGSGVRHGVEATSVELPAGTSAGGNQQQLSHGCDLGGGSGDGSNSVSHSHIPINCKLMTKQHKLALMEKRDVIIDNMNYPEVLNHLEKNGVLSQRDISDMKKKDARADILEAFVSCMLLKPDHAYGLLVKALRDTDQHHVANEFDDFTLDQQTVPITSKKQRTGKGKESANSSVEVQVHAAQLEMSPQSTPRRPSRRTAHKTSSHDQSEDSDEESESESEICRKALSREMRRIAKQELKNLHRLSKKPMNNFNIKCRKEIRKTLRMLRKCKRSILDIEEGSVVFRIYCPTLSSLNDLWTLCESGQLAESFERAFITQDLKRRHGITKVRFAARIGREDYLRCWNYITRRVLDQCVTPRRYQTRLYKSAQRFSPSSLAKLGENAIHLNLRRCPYPECVTNIGLIDVHSYHQHTPAPPSMRSTPVKRAHQPLTQVDNKNQRTASSNKRTKRKCANKPKQSIGESTQVEKPDIKIEPKVKNELDIKHDVKVKQEPQDHPHVMGDSMPCSPILPHSSVTGPSQYQLRSAKDNPATTCYVSPLYSELRSRSYTSRLSLDHPLVSKSPDVGAITRSSSTPLTAPHVSTTQTPLQHHQEDSPESLQRRESYLSTSSSGFVSSPESSSRDVSNERHNPFYSLRN